MDEIQIEPQKKAYINMYGFRERICRILKKIDRRKIEDKETKFIAVDTNHSLCIHGDNGHLPTITDLH